MIRVTIYANNLEDAQRAMRAICQEAKTRPNGCGKRKREGALWSGIKDDFHALIWGGPKHYRADCRKAEDGQQ